ncbi:MAG: dihydrolipoyllysine-residue succinyltransferase [Bacteroidota bacterium]
MIIEILVPAPGESITEVQIASWLCEDGTIVDQDQEIVEVDSDKATLTLTAPDAGKISIVVQEGETASVGSLIATIDTDYEESGEEEKAEKKKKKEGANKNTDTAKPISNLHATPLAKSIISERKMDIATLSKTFGDKKIHISDLSQTAETSSHKDPQRAEERKKMSMLRKKLSERLVSIKNETAMLTSFNEINLESLITLRKKHSEAAEKKYGFAPGYVAWFAYAVCRALKEFPVVNARIDGEEIVSPSYMDIGIAVSTPRGLMVPVLKNAHEKTVPELEQLIRTLAEKARNGKITPDEMSGGTFSITNGGVFGSMMSTPILNPPQSGILGMHKIMERPIAVNGKVEIKPMMYVALSYDHRLIDGRESVGFLIKVKEILENPDETLFVE